jgi:hypothetical protein
MTNLNSLRILGKDWAVKWVEMSDHGECDSSALAIKVSVNQHQDQQKDALLHETIHAIDYTAKLNLSEEQVHALAGLLLAVFRDNPSFAECLVAV